MRRAGWAAAFASFGAFASSSSRTPGSSAFSPRAFSLGLSVLALGFGGLGCGRPPADGVPPLDSAPLTASASASAVESAAAPVASAAAPAAPVLAPLAPEAAKALAEGPCVAGSNTRMFVSPLEPAANSELRVVALSKAVPPSEYVLLVEQGKAPVVVQAEPRNGPPSSALARFTPGAAGSLKAIAVRDGAAQHCETINVAATAKRLGRAGPQGLPWSATRAWDSAMEDLFSAWVEALFDAPDDEFFSASSLHEFTSDEERNFLHNHLGADEDQAPPKGLRLDPDCADLPYFLRAYFSFKLGLPFGFSKCSRGGGGQAPRCQDRQSNLDPLEEPIPSRWKRFETFARVTLKNSVHSGTGRTLAADDTTDYYPVPLSRESLRPGTIYADPYGHILVVAKLLPQVGDKAGVLFAVDGQPDGTVAKKRFWEGNFLFVQDEPAMGNPGFKRFRPITAAGGNVRALSNKAIAERTDWGDHSLEQSKLSSSEFYERMDLVLSPAPRDPEAALLNVISALEEQVKTRVGSVENGEKYFRDGGARIDMPNGASIFETVGNWENFSTPSRDLRLLIAIDVVQNFAKRVKAHPERFRLAAGANVDEVVSALEARLQKELGQRSFSYSRSDGSRFELKLADVVARSSALEVAFNPNDCAELRWGAEPASSEASTCKRRAPRDQARKMETARAWFKSRKRPSRG